MRPIRLCILICLAMLTGCAANGPKSVPQPEPVVAVPTSKPVLTNEQQAAYERALGLLKSGELAAAEVAFNELGATLPKSPGVFANLGIIAEAKNDVSSAINWYQKSLSLKADYVVALNNLGNIWLIQGKFDEAEALYLRAYKADSGNQKVLLNLAMLNELYKHDLQEAIKYYQRYQSAISQPDEVIIGRISDIERRLN